MADYEGARPVRTAFDDEFKGKIVDGKSGDAATRAVSVVRDGDAVAAASNDESFPAMVLNASDVFKLLKITNDSAAIKTDTTGAVYVIPTVESADASRVVQVFSELLDGKNGADPIADFIYAVTDAQRFNGELVTVGARGQVKVTVATTADANAVTPTWTPVYTWFQTPQDNPQYLIPGCDATGNALGDVAVRVRVENLEANQTDVYCTLEGIEAAP